MRAGLEVVYCEFRLHIQNDLTVMLEGVKSLQFISHLDSGKLGDGQLDREPCKRFYIYCKVGEGRSRVVYQSALNGN